MKGGEGEVHARRGERAHKGRENAHKKNGEHPHIRDGKSPGMRDRESAQGGEVSLREWESKRERNSFGEGGKERCIARQTARETGIAREKHKQRYKNPV